MYVYGCVTKDYVCVCSRCPCTFSERRRLGSNSLRLQMWRQRDGGLREAASADQVVATVARGCPRSQGAGGPGRACAAAAAAGGAFTAAPKEDSSAGSNLVAASESSAMQKARARRQLSRRSTDDATERSIAEHFPELDQSAIDLRTVLGEGASKAPRKCAKVAGP